MKRSIKKSVVNNNSIEEEKEDKNIKKVAYKSNNNSILLLVILTLLFLLVLSMTLCFVKNYYNKKNIAETILINSKKSSISIDNSEEISEIISNDTFSNENQITIERINKINISPNKNFKNGFSVYFNVKYYINKNDFSVNIVPTLTSNVLVKFAYSYDKVNWTYLSNAISTIDGVITPVNNNFYDISGLVNTLNVATNFEVALKPLESKTMYWKSETIIQKSEYSSNIKNKEFDANFKVEYKDSI